MDHSAPLEAKFRVPPTGIFGPAAPPANLRLPKGIPVTSVETLVYFPNWIRNIEVLERLVQAGLSQVTIANIVNCHRLWDKWPARENSLRKSLEKAFVEQGYQGWSISNYRTGGYVYDRVWGEEELTYVGVRLNCERDPKFDKHGNVKKFPVDVPFADLAIDVAVHPSYLLGDGFILTRCVQYAAANPTEGYMFPRDVDMLAAKLYDNRHLKPAHLDRASALRWKTKKSWSSTELPQVESFINVLASDDEGTSVLGVQGPSAASPCQFELDSAFLSTHPLENGHGSRDLPLPDFHADVMSDVELTTWQDMFTEPLLQRSQIPGRTCNLRQPALLPSVQHPQDFFVDQDSRSGQSVDPAILEYLPGQVARETLAPSVSQRLALQPGPDVTGHGFTDGMNETVNADWQAVMENLVFNLP